MSKEQKITIEFTIKKKGKNFVAYNNGMSRGHISIATGKCVGATMCFDALRKHWEKHTKTLTQYKLKVTGSGTKDEIIEALKRLLYSVQVAESDEHFRKVGVSVFEDETLNSVFETKD